MPWLRVVVLGAALALLPDCTNVSRLSAGPVLALPGNGHESYGEQISVHRGIGTSDFDSIGIAEYEARLLVTEETQALSLGAGYSGMKWWGSGLAFVNLDPALGLEITREKPLGNAGLHGALGFGFTFDEQRSQRPVHWRPDVVDPCPFRDCSVFQTIERNRSLITLELTGSADLRGTRQPLYTLGLLLGVTFTNEQDDVELPPIPPRFPFRLAPPTRP